MKEKLNDSDFLSEIKKYLEAKYGESYTFSPTMIDPVTLGVQMAIFEKTVNGVERRFDLIIKDRGERIKLMYEQNEMADIRKIIMNTIKVVPKAWEMNHQHFNCDCHMELTDKTYELVGKRFDVTSEEGKKIVDNYFIITNGNV